MDFNAPWLEFYGDVPHTLDYPDCSMEEIVEQTASRFPDISAYDFFGAKTAYRDFVLQIHTCAKALLAQGIAPGDRVTICMPNTPQALIMFYAINLMGGVANMIHPLSAEGEIIFYLNSSKSVAAITLDQFYPKFHAIADKIALKKLIIANVAEAMPLATRLGFKLTKGRKIQKVTPHGNILLWRDFMKSGSNFSGSYIAKRRGGDIAAILYSGGTTGTTKGILLTNLNFNALAMQTAAAGNGNDAQGLKMLAIMPIFHGFGLGVCIHTALFMGATCLLVPQFTVKSYAKLLAKKRPHYIAGVPTLYEGLLRIEGTESIDMSQLRGVFSGGDSLSIELKSKVDAFLQKHGSTVQVREGYGTTECVTASCLTPQNYHRTGSIGVPFPDTFYKIVTPGTKTALAADEVGEICISGPTVMSGYLDNPAETAEALKIHDDGMLWLHTGDLGFMDSDGFIYFKQRLKRVIISSGYNIFPSQLENIIDACDTVLMSCVIGVPDAYKIHKPKAFVVLKPGISPTDEVKNAILEHCRKNIAKYAMPCAFEYRDALPKTLVGKVAYTVLEQEEANK